MKRKYSSAVKKSKQIQLVNNHGHFFHSFVNNMLVHNELDFIIWGCMHTHVQTYTWSQSHRQSKKRQIRRYKFPDYNKILFNLYIQKLLKKVKFLKTDNPQKDI